MELMQPATEKAVRYIERTYAVKPDFLWEGSPGNAAFRHKADKKWFAVLLMGVKCQRLALAGEGHVDILGLKCSPVVIGSLVDGRSILPGYHMNKAHWISVVLDGSVPQEKLFALIDMSYDLTVRKRRGSGQSRAGRKEE